MADKERRTAQRFAIELPMTVRWTNGSAISKATARSRDVCSQGIYFFLPNELKNGSLIEIAMILPHEITLAGPVNVRCFGRVRRSEKETVSGAGVAVSIESYQFLNYDAHTA